jgi:hypothetical protein
MSGENAEYSTGHVRTQLFHDAYRMPPYVTPPTVEWANSPAERSSLGPRAAG